MNTANTLPRPLEGIKVLAIENFVAGPLASMWLADAGAEVVKIEVPGTGDQSRSTPPLRSDEEGKKYGLSFMRTNRNKLSVELDLKSEEGKRVFLELAAKADIVLENLRPAVMEGLGLGWSVLQKLNPALIYVAISGYGHRDVLPGPYTDHPAFDIVAQAMTGLMYRPESRDGAPVYLGFSTADIQTGMAASQGALLALLQRARTGKGQKVDVALADTSLVMNDLAVALYSATGEKAKPGLHAVTAPFGAYKASDGYIVIAVLGDPIWKRFAQLLGSPQLLEDERFATGALRHANLAALEEFIFPWLKTQTRQQAVDAMIAAGVPAAMVQDVDDVLTCSHFSAREMLMTLSHPVWGDVQVPGNPIKMSDSLHTPAGNPPGLGEHTSDVLGRWLGYSEKQIEAVHGQPA